MGLRSGRPGPDPVPVVARIADHTKVFSDDEGEHIVWTGAVNRQGYPKMGRTGHGSGTTNVAHALYELREGRPVPAGYELAHECSHRACIHHVEPMEHAPHMSWDASRRTTCRRGHDRATEGHYDSSGRFRCRACMREDARDRRTV